MSTTPQSPNPSNPPSPQTYTAITTLFGTSDRTQEQRRDWDRNVIQAKVSLNQKRFEEGIALTTECLNSARHLFADPEPQLIACHVLLGRLHYEAKYYDLALASCHSALSLCESDKEHVYTTLTLLGYIAAIHVETGNSNEAISTYKKRWTLLSEMSPRTANQNSPIRELAIDTLKDLSALCLRTNDLGTAEEYSYQLATLQDRGLERGKTLLLLAQIYRSNGDTSFARDTAVQAQQELVAGGADHHEPLALATAYRLEARLLFDRKLFEFARPKYELARSIFCSVLGPRNLHTVLCGCDIAVVDMHLENCVGAAGSLDALLNQAVSLSPKGSNDPALRPYLKSSAMLEHKLGVVMHAALSEVEQLVQLGELSLSSVSKKLQAPGLTIAWRSIFDRFPRGVDRHTLLPFLNDAGQQHFDNALKRYIQVTASLQNQFGTRSSLEVAAVYDQMSWVHYALGNEDWSNRYRQRADLIRLKLENRDGGNQP